MFEPSAGNGLLTIAANPSLVIVNEIDELRRSNLADQVYRQALHQDATNPFKGFEKKFDAVITNPPFGLLDNEVKYETFSIEVLDHLMALCAMDCLRANGKAAIIIVGHTGYDKKERIKGKNRSFCVIIKPQIEMRSVLASHHSEEEPRGCIPMVCLS